MHTGFGGAQVAVPHVILLGRLLKEAAPLLPRQSRQGVLLVVIDQRVHDKFLRRRIRLHVAVAQGFIGEPADIPLKAMLRGVQRGL